MSTLRFAFDAVTPILLLTALGYLLRRVGLFHDGFLDTANKLVFRVCLPVLLFCNVYQIDGLSAIRWELVLLAVSTALLFFLLGLLLARLWIPDRRQKGVVIQGVFRSNFAIIGLPLATSIGGASGTAAASLLSAFTIPVYNVLAVISLSMYTGAQRPGFRHILRDISRNPLILGVLAGLLALVIRTQIPVTGNGTLLFSLSGSLPVLYEVLCDIGALASPLALLVLGGQFSFQSTRSLRKQLVLGVASRITLCPLLGLSIVWVLLQANLVFFTAGEVAALAALYGSPVAVSSAIMAGAMGNDEQLAGQLVVWSSVFSMVSLFFVILCLRKLGMV